LWWWAALAVELLNAASAERGLSRRFNVSPAVFFGAA
jgi:hypothetical protein